MSTEKERASYEDEVVRFMNSPLVQWVKTFKKSKEGLDFDELIDSVYLLDVLLTIEESCDGELMASINRSTSLDRNAKLHNWILLTRTLHRYYYECLQQVVVFTWPDVFLMTEETDKRGRCLMELEKFLVLILGYAVQCDRKECHIQAIKNLNVETQQALVSHIQQVTETPSNVLSFANENLLNASALSQTIKNLCRERLDVLQKLIELNPEGSDCTKSEFADKTKSRRPPNGANSNDEEREHRKQIRILDEKLEEKNKLLTELREQLCALGSELTKTKSENAILSSVAKAAKLYKDELESIKETAIEAQKYRQAIDKYKNVVADVDFYKTRLEELRKDNDLLIESKASIELQMASSNVRIEKLKDELTVCQALLQNSNSEKVELNKKIAELAEATARLEYEKSQITSGILASNMSRFMSITSIDCIPAAAADTKFSQERGNSISDEVNETLTMHLTRLQIENDELKMTLKEAGDKYEDLRRELEHVRREGESEFQRKLEVIQQQSIEHRIRNSRELTKEFEQKILEIEQRSKKLKQQVSKEFQQKISELEQQNQSLQQHVEELQKQIKFVEETRDHDREMCARLHNPSKDLLSERQLKPGKSFIKDDRLTGNLDTQSLQRKLGLIDEETDGSQTQTKKVQDIGNNCFGTSFETSSLKSASALNDDSFSCSQGSVVNMNIPYSSGLSTRMNREKTTETPRNSKNSTLTEILTDESKSKTPIRGIVAPLMRSTQTTAELSEKSTLHRSSHQPMQTPLPFESVPDRLGNTFSRNDRLHHSMPVTMSHNPQTRPSKGSTSKYLVAGQRPFPSNTTSSRPHSGRRDRCYTSDNRSSCDYDSSSLRSRHNNSNISGDSVVSQGRPQSCSQTKNGGVERTRWEMFYSEKTVTQTTESLLRDENSSYSDLVDHIMKLREFNQKLAAELRQKTPMTKDIEEKLSSLEERNLHLEQENKKLKQIIEVLNGSLPQSPYDRRTYQFNTIV